MALILVLLALLLASICLVYHFRYVAHDINALPSNDITKTPGLSKCEETKTCRVVAPMNPDSMHAHAANGLEFKKFVMSQYKLPWDVLGLPREAMHNMNVVTRQFYDLFEVAKRGGDSLELQTLCSSFFLLLLINTTKSNTTNVINNNLTASIAHNCDTRVGRLEV